MKSSLIRLLSILALAFVLAGCEKAAVPAAPAPPPDDKVLFQAIEDNLQALDKKDVDAVMATIHPQAPFYASTRQIVSQMFSSVDLKFTVSDLKVVTASADEAQVSFVQKTDKVGPEGRVPLNIVEGIDTLRPDNGKWKIYNTTNTKVTRLDKPPADLPKTTSAPPEPASPPEPAPKPAAPGEKPAAPAEKPAP